MHKIGILDSGIGGLTICSYIFRVMPDVNILYYADTLNAPYGSKSRREVYAAVRAGVSYLFDAGCDEVVIACNTATTTCIGELRGEFSKPIIGTEPELKNALSGAEKPLLLATPLTYENRRYYKPFKNYRRVGILRKNKKRYCVRARFRKPQKGGARMHALFVS